MYCQCSKPIEKPMTVAGIAHKVCAGSLGGCGKEIKEGHRVEKIDLSKEYPKEVNKHLLHAYYYHELPKDFWVFLHSRGIHWKFIKNREDQLIKYSPHSKNKPRFDFLKSPKEAYIDIAFTWGNTREGSQFWKNIDDAWRNTCAN